MTLVPDGAYDPEGAAQRIAARRAQFVEMVTSDIGDADTRQDAAASAGEFYDERIASYAISLAR